MSDKLLLTIISFNAMAALLPICMVILYKRPQWWHATLAFFLGFLVGFVNLQSDEVILPVLLLLAFGFFLGFSRAERGWLYAIILAMWVPVGQMVQLALHGGDARWFSEGLLSLVAFVPALIGVYSGSLIGRLGDHTPAGMAHK